MLATLPVVLPIFALIAAGYAVRRIGVLGDAATSELNRFVVFLALPALLFDVVAHARWQEIWDPAFIATYGSASLGLFGATLWLRMRMGGRPLADAAVDGMNAAYANAGFLGFPLALAALGPPALAPTTVAAIITVCVVFAAGIVLIETGLRRDLRLRGQDGPRRGIVGTVAASLVRNPILVAPSAGAVLAGAGVGVPGPVDVFVKLLGGAASPCALVALGLFLAQGRPAGGARYGATALLVGLKLAAHPALAYLLGRYVFGLPPLALHTAVLLAALPTGTGPFMLAEFYRREADLTATVVLASTILSLVTVSAYLAAI